MSKASRSYWIQNPTIDLVVGCGAWSAPLLLFAYVTQASITYFWTTAFYGLALFLNYPHYMATVYRAYRKEEDFRKYRFFTVHVTALVVLTGLVSHFLPQTLPWIFTLYLTWSPWHYSGQNYGILMMFARRAGAQPDQKQRWSLYLPFILSYAALFLTLHANSSGDALFRPLGLPLVFERYGVPLLSVAFALLSLYGLNSLRKQIGARALVPVATLLFTQFLWFLLPTLLSISHRLEIPQSRYSTGVLAIMHSAQYLWVTSYFAKRESGAAWKPVVYFGVLVVGGIALFIPGPWLASIAFHYDLTTSFLIFTALVNLHHFILDGAIWKLREGRVADLLLNTRTRVSEAAGQGASTLRSGLRWIASATVSARWMRVAAVILLVVLAGLDQARYVLAAQTSNLAGLQLAAMMNPHDASTLARLARLQRQRGNPEEAIASFQKAVLARPQDAALRNELLLYLIQLKRSQQAFDLSSLWIKIAPRDADLFVNRGILAMSLGQSEQAKTSWQRAIAIDPKQLNAQLYLADLSDRTNQPDQALTYYAAYLGEISILPAPQRPPAETVIATLLKFADCESRVGHNEQASRSLGLAEQMAQDNRKPDLEALALMDAALLKNKLEKPEEALPLFRRALQIDAQLNDRHVEAMDWYTFGLFLRDRRYPDRLAYTALLKSESLLRDSAETSQLANVAAELKPLEQRLGGQSRTIRQSLDPAIAELLSGR